MGRFLASALLAVLAALATAGEPAGPREEKPHRVVEAIRRLRSTERVERLRALRTIERFASQAVPYLVIAARHEDRLLRARVAQALGRVGKGDREALLALGVLLKDADPMVRREAIAALLKAGDASHVPALEALLADPVPEVRADAVLAIAALEPAKANERLTGLLEHADAQVRRTALAALIRRRPPELATLLATCLGDKDPGIRGDAAAALGRAQGHAAFPQLVRLLKDTNAYVRASAAGALKRFAPRTLSKATRKKMSPEQRATFDAREAAKARLASQAVPHILSLLDDPSVDVRAAAVSALGLLADPRVAERRLVLLLSAESRRVRARAAMALGFLRGARSFGATSALIDRLKDGDPSVRQKAHFALRIILKARVPFDPKGSDEQRDEAIRKWSEILQQKRRGGRR